MCCSRHNTTYAGGRNTLTMRIDTQIECEDFFIQCTAYCNKKSIISYFIKWFALKGAMVTRTIMATYICCYFCKIKFNLVIQNFK